jgi:arylsulfatase A-like enzyme
MNKKHLLLTSLFVTKGLFAGDLPQRPNIILMVADDLGRGCVEVFRADEPRSPQELQAGNNLPPIYTPNLNRLAEDGLKMTDFYANCSVCSPTRAALLTGLYQHRLGIVNVLGQTGNAFSQVFPEVEEPFAGLRSGTVFTMADALKESGYRTGMIGKWHLGPFLMPSGYHPLDHGFEHYVGVSGSAGNMFSMMMGGQSLLWRGRERVPASGDYWTFVQAEEALAFINQDDERPFFVYLAFNAPHPSSRVGPRDREAANQWDYKAPFRTDYPRIHKELVEALDKAVGMVRDGLAEAGLLENTLIVFTSDNGQNGYGYPPLNQHQGKQTVYEGGVRVPMIVHWPEVIQPGRVSEIPAITMDLMPTFMNLAGGTLPEGAMPLDGIDLTPVLLDQPLDHDRLLFWEKPYQVWMEHFANRIFAVRDGDWKLVRSHGDRPFELYNLKDDKSEMNDLANAYPERVQLMVAAFDQWKATVYADAPYSLDEFIERLRREGIVTD